MDMPGDRRPLRSRDAAWARAAAHALANAGVTPNGISVGSVLCGAVAGAALAGTRFVAAPAADAALLVFAAVAMQGRLLCNLFDGMVAVEGGYGASVVGEIYNDLPDRVADLLIFAGAGVCVGGEAGAWLGLSAGALAVTTAYVRVLGKSMGARPHFAGPMAKQHRMATLTFACVVAAVLVFAAPAWLGPWMAGTLGVVCVGCVATIVNRLRRITRDLLAGRGVP